MKFTKYIICACFLSLTANASVLLEPYVGYHTGSTHNSTSGSDPTQAGSSYGGRLGWEGMVLMLGADYGTGSWTVTPSSGSTYTATPSDVGAFIGFNLPIIRGYAEYIVSSSEALSGNGSTTLTGSGYKVGVGFKILPLLSINLEYMGHTYTKDNAGTLNMNITDSMYGATVSLPFNLFSK